MIRSALKVVESPSFYREEVDLWDSGAGNESHSLHYSIPYPSSFTPEFAAYFIAKYTRRGQVVLDPFAGMGTTALESCLSGRIAFASDISPLAMRLVRAKLEPADISEVTLWLQQINLSRPVGLELYRKYFTSFFDPDTFREIVNLKSVFQGRTDRVSRFIELTALSLLHGHSAGYFSVYSFPQVSLSPQEQSRINARRNQRPDYRSVPPRILRKAALMLRDGIPSILHQMENRGQVAVSDARDLSYVPSSSVDLVLTGPPLLGSRALSQDLWMRMWFCGLDHEEVLAQEFYSDSLDEWRGFMNEVLVECARVVRGGGRLVLDLREVRIGNSVISLDDEIVALVSQDLSRYWDPECALIQKQKAPKIRHSLRDRDEVKARNTSRVLILRRR